jgi:hypothetical protein
MIAFEVKSWGRQATSLRLLASGSGSWTEVVEARGATTVEIACDTGCTDAGCRAFVQTLKAADSIVAGWGRARRVLRTEAL